MIESLRLLGVGPQKKMDMRFTPRFNLLTGDNGLGKSFVLDIAWWAMTGTWAGLKAIPPRLPDAVPSIEYSFKNSFDEQINSGTAYDFTRQVWSAERSRNYFRGLAIYAKADGGFSFSFPIEDEGRRRPRTANLSREHVWDGSKNKQRVPCNGLISDWVNWKYRNDRAGRILSDVLRELSPHRMETIQLGEPRRIDLTDPRDIPTIDLSYGNIPVTHASAGMRRVLALAYMLVWSWHENKVLSEMKQARPLDRMVLIFDEIEAHLHPQWQRVILPAVLRVIQMLHSDIKIQVLATTHAPLILSSVEAQVSKEQDTLFNFELDHNGHVRTVDLEWAKYGDASEWLTSEAFDLKQSYSRDAEILIEAADAFMRGDKDALPNHLPDELAIDAEMKHLLAGDDTHRLTWFLYRGGKRI